MHLVKILLAQISELVYKMLGGHVFKFGTWWV